jgi:hypothetical protein
LPEGVNDRRLMSLRFRASLPWWPLAFSLFLRTEQAPSVHIIVTIFLPLRTLFMPHGGQSSVHNHYICNNIIIQFAADENMLTEEDWARLIFPTIILSNPAPHHANIIHLPCTTNTPHLGPEGMSGDPGGNSCAPSAASI